MANGRQGSEPARCGVVGRRLPRAQSRLESSKLGHRCQLIAKKKKMQMNQICRRKKGLQKDSETSLFRWKPLRCGVGCRVHAVQTFGSHLSEHLPPPSSRAYTPSLPSIRFVSASLTMEHCIGLLIEPLIGLVTMCAEVAGICVDGCLQTSRETCRCIACPCSVCARDYQGTDQEAQPILTRSQPTATDQPTWSSVRTLREQSND